MRNFLFLTFTLSIFTLIIAFAPLKEESGHIYKMDVEVDEHISRMAIDHYGSSGKPVFKGEGEYENFSQEQVQGILVNFEQMLTTISGKSPVSHEPAKVSLSNKFGNIGSNALGKSKMPYFPKNKLKKVKVTADEYYEIEIDFAYGGGKGRTIVMNKISKVSTIKFNVNVQITAYSKSGDELWEKEQKIRDFSEVFSDDASDYEVGEKWFELSRAPIAAGGQKEKVGDVPLMNVHEDEFWPLTLDEIQSCIEVAFAKTLQE